MDVVAFLASLRPQPWDQPTRCEGRRVRDVAASRPQEPSYKFGILRSRRYGVEWVTAPA